MVVGFGGLACIYAGVRGIIEATGIDDLVAVLSWGVATTGLLLVLGASLGLVARVRARHRTVTQGEQDREAHGRQLRPAATLDPEAHAPVLRAPVSGPSDERHDGGTAQEES